MNEKMSAYSIKRLTEITSILRVEGTAKSCPFCHEMDIQVKRIDWKYRVATCRSCKAQGPLFLLEDGNELDAAEKVIWLWNERGDEP